MAGTGFELFTAFAFAAGFFLAAPVDLAALVDLRLRLRSEEPLEAAPCPVLLFFGTDWVRFEICNSINVGEMFRK